MLRQRGYIHESRRIKGYKVMRMEGGKLISGANSKLSYPARVGAVIRMPGKGLYLSLGKQYVLDYYSGLAENEALLTFEFDEGDVIFGNLTDRETELSVKSAKITKIKKLPSVESISENDQSRMNRASITDDVNRLPNVHKVVPSYIVKEMGWDGKSEATIYRGTGPGDPNKTIRPGDWVALKKRYAEQMVRPGGRLLKKRVKAWDVVWAGTDANEWFYVPMRTRRSTR